jgi:putative transposase
MRIFLSVDTLLSFVSKYEIQKQLYYDVKGIFDLPAQSVIRLISKAVEVYKRDKNKKPVFRELGAIQYDQRNSRIGIDKVSLITLKGRLKLATSTGEYQRTRFDRIKGQC